MRPEAAIARAAPPRRFGWRLQAAGLAAVAAIGVLVHCGLPMLM